MLDARPSSIVFVIELTMPSILNSRDRILNKKEVNDSFSSNMFILSCFIYIWFSDNNFSNSLNAIGDLESIFSQH